MDNRNLKKAMDKYGKEYIKELTKQLLLADKKATGKLVNTLSYEVLETTNGLVLNIKAAAYLKYVDGGRKAGSKPPPVTAIKKWVAAKRIKFTSGKKKLTQMETAFIVARSIGKKGIKPTNVLKKAQFNFMANKNALNELLSGAKSDLVDLIDQTIKNIYQ